MFSQKYSLKKISHLKCLYFLHKHEKVFFHLHAGSDHRQMPGQERRGKGNPLPSLAEGDQGPVDSFVQQKSEQRTRRPGDLRRLAAELKVGFDGSSLHEGQHVGRYFVKIEEFEVMVGSRDIRDGEDATNQQTTTSDTFIGHEGYKFGRPETMVHDVALLLLNEQVFYSDWVRPAVLSHVVTDPETNWNCRVSGWGVFGQAHDGKRLVDLTPHVLQVADKMNVVQNYRTQFSYATLNKKDKMCQSSFEGDSGGPVACRQSVKHEFGNVVHGIVSGGFFLLFVYLLGKIRANLLICL